MKEITEEEIAMVDCDEIQKGWKLKFGDNVCEKNKKELQKILNK